MILLGNVIYGKKRNEFRHNELVKTASTPKLFSCPLLFLNESFKKYSFITTFKLTQEKTLPFTLGRQTDFSTFLQIVSVRVTFRFSFSIFEPLVFY